MKQRKAHTPKVKFLNILTKRHFLVAGSILLTTLLFCFSAFALSINRSPLSIYEKSDGVIVDDSESLEENDTIIPNIKFSQPGDFITYKLTLNNSDNSEYKITNISDSNTNENIAVSYSYDDTANTSDKDIYVTLTYTQESTNDLSLTDFEVTINYEETAEAESTEETSDEEDLPVPNTGSTNAPNTGDQTFSQTFNAKSSNRIFQNILLSALICILVSMFYLLFRRSRKNKEFNLEKISRSRKISHNLVGLIIAGLIITGGAISITYAANNSSIKLRFDLSKVELSVNPISQHTINFINNAPNVVTNIQETTKTCDLQPDESSCEIILPSFTTKQNHEVLGWSTNKNATEASYQPGEIVSFSDDTTLYTITRGKFSASFVNQHKTHFNLSHESDSCYVYNSTSNCRVATPTASKQSANDESEFLGWSTDSTSAAPEIAAGGSASISENTAFYSIASIPPTIIYVQFVNQDPNGISVSQESTTCTIPENETECSITLPTITANPGYNALGWSKYSSLTTAAYSAEQAVTVSGSTTFYTVSYKTLTATFNNLHTDYFSASSSSATCQIYNGAVGGCTTTTPTITKLTDDERTTFLGWNTNPNTNVGTETGASLLIYDNNTYYSIAKIPTDTIYSLKFSNDIWDTSTLSPLSYFSSTEDCTRSSEGYCIEVRKRCTIYTWESSCTITAPEFDTISEWRAYGYDTIHPLAFSNPLDKTDNFAEIGQNIIITADNNDQRYYNMIIKQTPVTASFINQHTDYLASSSNSQSCYALNNNKSCKITTPDLAPKQTNNDITKVAWSRSQNTYQSQVNPGEIINISKDTTFYSAATGIAYTITFDKNVNFEGSDPTGCRTKPQLGGCDDKQNNLAADSLSFYSAKCVVKASGCYLANLPRIYSTSNIPLGFSLSQYGDANIASLLEYNFIADTTVYARVIDRANVTTDADDPVHFNETAKIYEPGSSTEYYQVDFDEDLKDELVDYYGPYIERVFQNAPQLFVMHGKMRFFSREHYKNYFGSSLAHVATTIKLYSPVEFSPNNSNAVDEYSKTSIVHEFGHAIDAAWGELYGTNGSGLYGLSSQPDIRAIHDYYKEKKDNGEQVPLRTYGNYAEFFGDAFAVWYRKKSGMTQDSAHGYITEDIEAILDSYLCNPAYDKIPYISSSPVCGNGTIIQDVVYN